MLSLSGMVKSPVNASVTGSLVTGTAKIVGNLALFPVKLASGVVIQIALPAALTAGASVCGLNLLLANMTEDEVKLFSLDSIKAQLGYSSKGNNLVGVSVGQLRNLVDYASYKFEEEQVPVTHDEQLPDENLLGLVEYLSAKETWEVDGLEQIELQYLLDRNNDDNHVITKEDILDTLINSRKDLGKAAKRILSKQKDKVNSLFINLFTNKVF